MSIITTTSLESNKRIKINFKGGDLSSREFDTPNPRKALKSLFF